MASASEPLDASNARAQQQSPLFGKLPGEIRNQIFELALQQYEDPESPYEKSTYYTRPGHAGKKRVDIALLQTCKLAYAEARLAPFRTLELAIYLGHRQRVPEDYISEDPRFQPDPRFPPRAETMCYEALGNEKLFGDHWSAIKHVHIFAQLFALDGASVAARFGNRKRFKPSTVTITIRYTDWWYWENDRKLTLMNFSTQLITWPDSVEKIVMEFETREGKRRELDPIIKGIMDHPAGWQYPRENRDSLRLDMDEGVKEWNWAGPTTFGGTTTYPHHGDKDTMPYIVKVLTWKPAPMGEEDGE